MALLHFYICVVTKIVIPNTDCIVETLLQMSNIVNYWGEGSIDRHSLILGH